MIKASFSAEQVKKNIKDTLDLTKNFRPLMLQLLGKPYSLSEENKWTLRGHTLTSFTRKQSSLGEASWPPLTAEYFKRKQMKYPGMPTGVRTRRLIDSTQREPGTDGAVVVMTARQLIYGTTVPYATYFNSGTKYLHARRFMGLDPKTTKLYKSIIAKYVKETTEGRKPGRGGVKL